MMNNQEELMQQLTDLKGRYFAVRKQTLEAMREHKPCQDSIDEFNFLKHEIERIDGLLSNIKTCYYCHKEYPKDETLPIQVGDHLEAMCVYCDELAHEARKEMILDDEMEDEDASDTEA